MLKIATSAILVTMSTNIQASSLDEFYQHFKSGQYQKALSSLDKIQVDDSNISSKAYLAGLSYSRLQEFDKAVAQFEIAIQKNNDSKDLQYEYGQALYAANELKKARAAFQASANKNFNKPASQYYIAHISQMLEEHEVAKNNYTAVIRDKQSEPKIKQVSYFQLGETLLSIARQTSTNKEELSRRVDKFILPMMALGLRNDKESDLAKEIKNRMNEIMLEFELDPNFLSNGRRINPKRYNAYVAQRIKYDNNITLVNEVNNVQETKKSSMVFETEAYGKYDFILKKRFIVSPEARVIFIQHSNQSDFDVYQNDSFITTLSLKNKYEHKYKEQPASLLFDIDFSKTTKKWQTDKRENYSTSTTFSIGETFNPFTYGDTTIKLKRKIYKGENEDISNNTTSLTADQIFFLPNQHLIVGSFDASFIDNYNNTTTSSNSYTLRGDYIIPDIKPKYTLDVALALTLTDTLEQKSTRGMELLINPSFDVSYNLNRKSVISVNYDYTKSSSDDENYAYTKHIISTEYRYAF